MLYHYSKIYKALDISLHDHICNLEYMIFFLFILRFSYQFWSIVLENWLINEDSDIKLIYLIWCWINLVGMLSVKLANNIPNKRYAIFEHECVCVCVLYNYILYHRMVWRIVVKLHSRSLPAEFCILIMFIHFNHAHFY